MRICTATEETLYLWHSNSEKSMKQFKLFNLAEIARFLQVSNMTIQRKVKPDFNERFTHIQKIRLAELLREKTESFIKEYLT